MQYVNGNAAKRNQGNGLSQSDEATAENEQAANPPAMVFQNGQVSMWGWDDHEKAFLARLIGDIVYGRIEVSDSFRRAAHQSAGWFGVRP